jgi:diaminohydroxyphosphoribosylaminopyrimidine deaminase/5-amino-6-(5-phosphoribosylamino)uracil reductase
MSSGAGRVGNYEERRTLRGPGWVRRPRLILATTRNAGRDSGAFASAGWEVWRLPAVGGRVSLEALLVRAAAEGFLQILAEAGPRLAGALLEADLVDEISLYLAPTVLGGRRVWPAVEAAAGRGDARFEHVAQRRVGEDLWLGLRRRGLVDRLTDGRKRRAASGER